MLADRAFRVPEGHTVATGYVNVWKIRLACRDRMGVEDVGKAFQKRLNLRSVFPPPNGYWDGDEFVINDGRHEYIAALMLGDEYLLVAWVEGPPKIS